MSEQSGIYSSGKLDIYVGNHTQIDGGVINSTSGDLTLDTGTLGFTTIKDHDTGSSFDMTVGFSYSDGNEKTNNYPWMPATNTGTGGSSGTGGGQSQQQAVNPQTGSPNNVWAGGAIENHDREQDTNATVGAGTIIIRNQEAQQQDVAALNRDNIDQAQVITKDESSGVQFYVSSGSLQEVSEGFRHVPENIMSAVENSFKAIDVAGKGMEYAVSAALDNLVSSGQIPPQQKQEIAAIEKEIRRNPKAAQQAASCVSGGGQSGFNIFELFVTTAHAATSRMCTMEIKSFETEVSPSSVNWALALLKNAPIIEVKPRRLRLGLAVPYHRN